MSKKLTIIVALGLCLAGLFASGVAWVIHARSEGDSGNCRVHLMQIDAAEQNWALAHNKTTNDVPTWEDIRPYLPRGRVEHEIPVCPQGGKYTIGRLDEAARCSIGGPGHSL
jgi:hypothetical protein